MYTNCTLNLYLFGIYVHLCLKSNFKEGLQRLLHIGSAHNIGRLHDLEIAQILYVLNFFEHKFYLLFF